MTNIAPELRIFEMTVAIATPSAPILRTRTKTFPTEEVNQAVQANVVAARYREATLEIFPSLKDNRP
ncbi:hypothetical protein IKP13_01850, partial [bacterium]|nr:hypothetical protein [bacterium]